MFERSWLFKRSCCLRSNAVFLQDLLLKIRMRLAISGEMLDKTNDSRMVLVECLDDLRRLRFDGCNIPLREGRLPVEKDRDGAADDNQRK